MRLPWVSRSAFEQADGERTRACDQLRLFSNRYDALLEKYHALRLMGANAVPESRAVEAKEPDVVQYAIAERAGNRHGLKLYLTGWAAQMRANNVEDTAIVEGIVNWQRDTDDE